MLGIKTKTLPKIGLCYRYFPVNFEKISRTPICVPLRISDWLYFLRFSKVWRMHGTMSHHRSLDWVHSKNNLCFFHFCFFFDKVLNFHNRILVNQKQELVIRIVSGTLRTHFVEHLWLLL